MLLSRQPSTHLWTSFSGRIFPLSEGVGICWNHCYCRFSRCTWYCVHLGVADALASSPSSLILLAPCLVRWQTGLFGFLSSFFLRGDSILSHHTIICKRYVSAMAAVTLTWCHTKSKVCPDCTPTAHVSITCAFWGMHIKRIGVSGKKVYVTGLSTPRTHFLNLFLLRTVNIRRKK